MGLVAAAASFGQFVIYHQQWRNRELVEKSYCIVNNIIVITGILPFLKIRMKKITAEEFQNNLQNTHITLVKRTKLYFINHGFLVCGLCDFIALHLPTDLMFKGISAEVAGWPLQ